MSIREARPSAGPAIAGPSPISGQTRRAISPAKSGAQTHDILKGARRGRANGASEAASIFSAEPSGLYANDRGARDRLMSGLARIDIVLTRVLASGGSKEERETLALGHDLVGEIGRRLQILRAGAETSIEAS